MTARQATNVSHLVRPSNGNVRSLVPTDALGPSLANQPASCASSAFSLRASGGLRSRQVPDEDQLDEREVGNGYLWQAALQLQFQGCRTCLILVSPMPTRYRRCL